MNWSQALDQSLLDSDTVQDWFCGHMAYQEVIETNLEPVQRHIALGRPLDNVPVRELVYLLMAGSDEETLAAKGEIRQRYLAEKSEIVAKSVWTSQDRERESGASCFGPLP